MILPGKPQAENHSEMSSANAISERASLFIRMRQSRKKTTCHTEQGRRP